jgi:hypothetical protein
MLPLPRALKRLAAPFFVFILGMLHLCFAWSVGDSLVGNA